MKKSFISILLAIFANTILSAQTVPNIIPIPKEIKMGVGEFYIQTELSIYTNVKGKDRKTLLENLGKLPFGWKIGKKENCQLELIKNQAESTEGAYSLTISTKKINISANSSEGLFYGLQSFRQLLQKKVENNFSVPICTISDSPRFNYRGFMLDVSRHFYPVSFIKKQIDAMAYYKLNRLHLHLTDAAGWRIEIKKYPRLTSYAAWRPQQKWKDWWNGDRSYMNYDNDSASGGFFTQKDIRELVKYAENRHITIIPEIEMPAHSEEAMAAYPFLSCPNVNFRNGDICAGKDSTYQFLENALSEVIDLFPSKYIHIGGDEAGKGAWKNCPHCKARMKKENLSTLNELQAYMIVRIGKFLESKKRKMLGWDEITDGKIPTDAVVMSWRNEQGAIKAIETGNQAIMTPGEFCYLDAYQDAPLSQPEAIGGYLSLEKIYSYDPTGQIPEPQKHMILGVQANLWTEYVPTTEQAEMMIWPRLLALSEVAWSAPKQKSWSDFHKRALSAVDFLTSSGYQAFDLKNEIGNRTNAQHPIKHKALGKKVTYIGNFSEAYPATGTTALTDGLCGGWSYNDKRWQGFIGTKRLEVVIDMDSILSIKNIEVCFLQSAGAEVYIPANIEYSVSSDGNNYTSIFTEQNPVNTSESIKYHDANWFGNVSARFVKIKATATREMGGWVFIDEIIIK